MRALSRPSFWNAGLAFVLAALLLGVFSSELWSGQATLPLEFEAAPEAAPAKPKAHTPKSSPTRSKPQSLPSRFSKDGLGVITDSKTGLQWFVGPDKDLHWNQALSWATGLKVAGGRWRLPLRAELQGLCGGGESEGLKIHPIFLLKHTFVWSGETRDEVKVWVFNFGLGNEFADNRGLSNDVRAFAVRAR